MRMPWAQWNPEAPCIGHLEGKHAGARGRVVREDRRLLHGQGARHHLCTITQRVSQAVRTGMRTAERTQLQRPWSDPNFVCPTCAAGGGAPVGATGRASIRGGGRAAPGEAPSRPAASPAGLGSRLAPPAGAGPIAGVDPGCAGHMAATGVTKSHGLWRLSHVSKESNYGQAM